MSHCSLAAAFTAITILIAAPMPAAAQERSTLEPIAFSLADNVQAEARAEPSSATRKSPPVPASPPVSVPTDAELKVEALKAKALKWELAYLALSAIDTAQTIDCLSREVCSEVNPLFGKHPSATRLILTKAGLGLLHFAAFRAINKRNPKAALLGAQISAAVQGGVVLLNARFAFK